MKTKRQRSYKTYAAARAADGVRAILEREAAAALRSAGRSDTADEVARQIERMRIDEIAGVREDCLADLPHDHPAAQAVREVSDHDYVVEWQLRDGILNAHVQHPALDDARAVASDLRRRCALQLAAEHVARARALAPVGPLCEPDLRTYWWVLERGAPTIIAQWWLSIYRAGTRETEPSGIDLYVRGEEILGPPRRFDTGDHDSPVDGALPDRDGFWFARDPRGHLPWFVVEIRGGLALRWGDHLRYTLAGVEWLGPVPPPERQLR